MSAEQFDTFMLSDLSKPLRKLEAIQLALAYQQNASDSMLKLLQIINSANQSTAFHAAWVLEIMVWNSPSDLLHHKQAFLSSFTATSNGSVKRHYAKILVRLLKLERANKLGSGASNLLSTDDSQAVVEAAFDWLIQDDTRVAVKAHCIELLQLLSDTHPWINENLPAIVNAQAQTGSPGMQAIGRRIR